MRLVLFDIDGTLVRSEPWDTELFVRAFDVAHGIRGIDPDWSSYAHCTDAWITRSVLRERLGRAPVEAETAACRDAFVDLLRTAHARDPSILSAVAGAASALAALRERGWAIGIGTGGWRASALFKLEATGIDGGRLPAAFAEDGESRQEILETARRRAEEASGRRASRTVYVGDAVWDVRTCATAGIPFVGIGAGPPAERLLRSGAGRVLPDLTDADALTAALDCATVPSG